MKTLILSFLLIITLGASAQIDSSKATVSATFQMRDLLFLQGAGILTPTEPTLKVVYDSVEAKIRRLPTYGLTNSVVIPAIQTRGLIMLSNGMRDRRFQPMYQHYDRINTAMRNASGATGRPYLLRVLNDLDAADIATANNFIEVGRQKNLAVD